MINWSSTWEETLNSAQQLVIEEFAGRLGDRELLGATLRMSEEMEAKSICCHCQTNYLP